MMNNGTWVGRLTAAPELRYTPNGIATCSFSLACERSFTNQAGEREADFVNVQAWKKAAETCANVLSKGDIVGVTGSIRTGKFTGQDGKNVYTWHVDPNTIKFIQVKKWQEGNNTQNNQPSRPNNGGYNEGSTNTTPRPQNPPQGNTDPFSYGQPINIDDQDLPF